MLSGYELYTDIDLDTAVAIPRDFACDVREKVLSKRYTFVVLFGTVWCSVHLPCLGDVSQDDLWSMLKEMEDVVINLRRRHRTSRIVIGSDLNVSLAPSLEGLTGSRIHSNANGASSRWREAVTEWMHSLRLRALCTFDQCLSLPHVEWDHDACWTHKNSNKGGLFQLDYMLVSEHVHGEACVVRGGYHLNSDHWPIDGSLRLERSELWCTINHDEFSQRGWVPKTDEAKQIFMRSVAKDLCWMNEETRGKALVSVEEIIYSHAVGIDSDNCAIRQWSGLQEHRKRLADLRTTLRQEAARDIRISLRRDIRRELNAKLRIVKGEQLNRLLAGYFDRGKQTLEMQLPDGPSSDRHAWAAAAGEHGREVYRDDNNNVDIQKQRLVRLQHLAQREIEAGLQPPAVKFHDFLNALASAKMGKQPGSDSVVVEMVRALSWSTLLWLYLLFLVRLGGWETERPDAWREVVLTAIPKKSDKVGFRSMRYISLLPVIQKFYIRALQSAVRRERKPHETNILGYEPGRSTAGVTATLRQVLSKAAEWAFVPLMWKVLLMVSNMMMLKKLCFRKVSILNPSALFCVNPVISRVELICLVPRCRLLFCTLVVLGREAWKALTCGIRYWTTHSENLQDAGKRREWSSCLPETTAKPKRNDVVHLVTL